MTILQTFPKAETAAQKASEINDLLAEAHNVPAFVLLNYDWNAAEAEKEMKIAVELKFKNHPKFLLDKSALIL